MKIYNQYNFRQIPQFHNLTQQELHIFEVLVRIFPFKVNEYVLNHLIDWDRIPNDPMYQLTFPQREMLSEIDFNRISTLIRQKQDLKTLKKNIRSIHEKWNPHCSDQYQNLAILNGEFMQGIQHKYAETVLFFPKPGQTCFSYCTFCFRWPQFVSNQIKFAEKEVAKLCDYLSLHPEITDVLITGGDPLIMRTALLKTYIQPLISEIHRFPHLQTIRVGSKALSYCPMRFIEEEDSSELIQLFKDIKIAGLNFALMAHFNHWKELASPQTQKAIRVLNQAGVCIRSQSPVLKHINDKPEIWTKMWKLQIQSNIVPYYMFVERDTGPHEYFEIPLVKAWQIYQQAIQNVSGLARTVRGPCMSTSYGKIEVQGITQLNHQKVFVLRFLQARNPNWTYRPFFAIYDETAVWFDDLKSPEEEGPFFFLK